MKQLLVAGLVLAATMASAPVAAHSVSKGAIQVRHPWARATPPGTPVGAGYLEIRNTGKEADRLTGAWSPVAGRIELHTSTRENGIVKMREAGSFEVPARKRLSLHPGGPHLMLIDLRQPLGKGRRFPLTLRFEKAGEVQVDLEIQAASSAKSHH